MLILIYSQEIFFWFAMVYFQKLNHQNYSNSKVQKGKQFVQ